MSKLLTDSSALGTEVIFVLLFNEINPSEGEFTILLTQQDVAINLINGVGPINVSLCACAVSCHVPFFSKNILFQINPIIHLIEADILSLSGKYCSRKNYLCAEDIAICWPFIIGW